MPTKLLSYKAVCDLTGRSRATIVRWYEADQFPRPIRLTESSVAFVASEVDAWLQGRMDARQPSAGA